MQQDKIIDRHEDDLAGIKKTLCEMSVTLKIISNDQGIIGSRFDNVCNKVDSLDVEIKKAKDALQKIEHFDMFKRAFLTKVEKWAQLAIFIVPAVIAIVGYLAYDIGLYKDVPTAKIKTHK